MKCTCRDTSKMAKWITENHLDKKHAQQFFQDYYKNKIIDPEVIFRKKKLIHYK